MSDAVVNGGELDRLVRTLDAVLTDTSETPGDAIDRVLAAPGRTTAVRSLADAPEIEAFRQELLDGLIRADTINRLLRLINDVVIPLLR
ncbi:MAG: hypothetical protein GXY55_18345 [Phycisphaerae bacterium]|nr:hypothetical protein [Phycisphaerae bacterium]